MGSNGTNVVVERGVKNDGDVSFPFARLSCGHIIAGRSGTRQRLPYLGEHADCTACAVGSRRKISWR